MTEEIGNAVRLRLSYVTVLDVGTFGTVHRAVLLDGRGRPARTVAVKRIRSSRDGGRHELDMHKRLRHPNLVRLMFYFYSGNGRQLNLGMECAPTNLYRVIERHASVGRTLSVGHGKLYAYQLFRGLGYMHDTAGLCHRDVKPSNLLLYPATGVLKLCDFGSAKDLHSHPPNSWYVCSRMYRAPELLYADTAVAAADYTNAVDVWSAGCVYVEMMTGRHAFPGTSIANQRALVTRPPVLPAALPADAVRLVTAALHLDPALRLTATEACGHECFDVLRSPYVRLPDGRPLPPLFDDDVQDNDDGDGDWPPLFYDVRLPTARKYYRDRRPAFPDDYNGSYYYHSH